MKKGVFIAIALLIFSNVSIAQDANEFDKKFRFGLRIAPQPTWYKSGNKNIEKLKSGFGFGFGLTMEFKLSDIVHLYTGIGGDLESGSVKYRDDGYKLSAPDSVNAGKFAVGYAADNEGNVVEAEDNVAMSDYLKNGSYLYHLDTRKYKTTHLTIPIALKMLTKEYSGLKYFAMFGGELAFRVKMTANDTYHSASKAVATGTNINMVNTSGGENTKIDISKDGSGFPMRLGMNVGAGTEYRIAGSTTLVFSINYFQAFTNTVRKESDQLFNFADNEYDSASNKIKFSNLKQSLTMSSIRINFGIMF